ncbi:calcium dependent mitochondrial carrier protein [Pyrenophora tritici-repentis]|nr:Calcium dependent mitochondrial carrier protein [Pyrenophora tritici-repentis]KAI1571550.1 calcium dependent mitochondrial carrier protein [Pyrenophora tritici-repentis]PZC90529.1 calcium dependent mitochondrial carrier protein [Pyrenophora tritici-repentis]PZD24335.1 calcium dependent mitochondrial carrier protein [Pyrenophora tritici-repentis]PZD32790.1 calcium dependent mitochondrial carrier protein [Pyrenophora tritici-repentis]
MDTSRPSVADARVDELWATLDTRKQGHLDLAGLKKGLRKLDHPLKNADQLLDEVMQAVDIDGNGRITYNEFRTFVHETEKELLQLFRSIDYNRDGKISRDELRSALRSAGLTVPNTNLDKFFSEVDTNNDGVISFEEWRDFLLFIPANAPSLHAVMSYFSATMKMNQEGDVAISDDVIQGLGTAQRFLRFFFGSLFLVARTPPYSPLPQDTVPLELASPSTSTLATQVTLPPRSEDEESTSPLQEIRAGLIESLGTMLIACVPNPGYFVAGGVAGIVSRTSTAPLDRLKVYLIAQTSVAEEAVIAAKHGQIVKAALNAWRPLATATKELWQAGGMRSLYAGNGLNVVKVMPESAIKFGSYEARHNDPAIIHSWSKFVSGGLAGMVSQFAVYPIDTLKFRMQCETVSGGLRGNRLIWATAKKMWQSGGVVAYYRGLPMGIVGIFPYAALDLGTFEYLKRYVARRNAKRLGCHESDAEPGGFMTAAIGGFSGAFGASAVYPLNLLRTRLQSQGTVLHPRTYTGIMDVTRQTIAGEGVRGLFKGLTPNLLKVVPAVSITYVVYDKSKKAIGLP